MLETSPPTHLPEMVACLAAKLEGLQVQARLSGRRLLVRIEGDPLPEPDPLLEHLAPVLEEMAATYGQGWVEIFAFPAGERIPEWHRQWKGQVQLNPNGPLYRAKQGDGEALRYVFNYLLRQKGIQARVHLHRKLGLLQVNLQAVEVPDPTWAKEFLRRTLTLLELPFLQRLRLSGQKMGSFLPSWSQEWDLKQASFWQAPPAPIPAPWVQEPPSLEVKGEESAPAPQTPPPASPWQPGEGGGAPPHPPADPPSPLD